MRARGWGGNMKTTYSCYYYYFTLWKLHTFIQYILMTCIHYYLYPNLLNVSLNLLSRSIFSFNLIVLSWIISWVQSVLSIFIYACDHLLGLGQPIQCCIIKAKLLSLPQQLWTVANMFSDGSVFFKHFNCLDQVQALWR